VAEWLDGLEKDAAAHVVDKVVQLEKHGLMILMTNMMKRIQGYGAGFYELRYSGYRIVLYLDSSADTVVLLHGFKKQRRRESHEIEVAYSRLQEYLQRG
jgi:mRNA-degrading endonuclease RelE of RelBE toxin-antitoxin system